MGPAPPAELPYTPLFCEENIWHLARLMLDQGAAPASLWVLFISNPGRQVVMYNQRRAAAGEYVVWDYHVVLQAGGFIYDFDTALPFALPVKDYFAASFGVQAAIAPSYRARVRRIPAASFLQRFFSDRRHMRGQIPDEAFPPWPAITPAGAQAIPLSDYWDMTRDLDDGSERYTAESYPRA